MEELCTERLVIREFSLTDADFVVQLLNEELFLQHIGDKGVRSAKDARKYLQDGPIASYSAYGYGLFHVGEKKTGKSLGMCGLLRRNDQPHPDIGFAFLEQYHAQGYAYESAMAVLDYGYDAMNLDTIVAYADAENTRSIRLLEKLGLRFTGETRIDGIPEIQSMFSAAQQER